MRLARQLEKRLERLVDGLSATIFRGQIRPVDVANRLVREADLMALEGDLGPGIPNRWTIHLAPSDVQAMEGIDLGSELTRALDSTAGERGWRTAGSVLVDVVPDDSVKAGAMRVEGRNEVVSGRPWGQLLDVGAGASFDLSDNRILVGRAEDADVRIKRPEVSRRHAVLGREAGAFWLRDLGSANGSFVNGRRVQGDSAALRPGDEVAFGPATFSFRLR